METTDWTQMICLVLMGFLIYNGKQAEKIDEEIDEKVARFVRDFGKDSWRIYKERGYHYEDVR